MHRIDVERRQVEELANQMRNEPHFIEQGLIRRYAVMKAMGMPPISQKLHPEKHFYHDHVHNWPYSDGCSLNDVQYQAVEKLLLEGGTASTCHCGNTIPYGGGVGPLLRGGPTKLFCSQKCNHHNPVKVVK